MDSQIQSPQIKVWVKNERCLCNGRRAYFEKYTHNGRRCTVCVCESQKGGEITNWKRHRNVSLDDLTEYPKPMPDGLWWDDNGFLCWPAVLPPIKKLTAARVDNGYESKAGGEGDSEPKDIDGGYESKAGGEGDSEPRDIDGGYESKAGGEGDSEPRDIDGGYESRAGGEGDSEPRDIDGGYESKAGGEGDSEPKNIDGGYESKAGGEGDSEPKNIDGGYESKAGGEGDSEPRDIGGGYKSKAGGEGDSEPKNIDGGYESKTGCLLLYCPAGSARGEGNYYRYQFKKNGKTHHKHIKGGRAGTKTADAHAAKIRKLIEDRKSPEEIIAVIASF